MTNYVWPDDLVPYAQSFYLQPHTGGSESPFSRVSKIYGLSAPRWVCTMAFRGGYSGTKDQAAFGPRLDALIAKLKGRQNLVWIWDFRRPRQRSPVWPRSASNLIAAGGATSMTVTGLAPGTPIYNGDYFRGDGTAHIICDDTLGAVHATADASGEAVVSFEPPLTQVINAGLAQFDKSAALFRLTSDDAGSNMVGVGEAQEITLEFVEDI